MADSLHAPDVSSATVRSRMPAIRRMTLLRVQVPLKKPVKHASHERTASENLVVRIELDDGTTGYGEGVPRTYVTGESIGSTFRALERSDWPRSIGRPGSFAEVVAKLEGLSLAEIDGDSRGMGGNAARCALELAVLDAYGRYFQTSIGEAVRLAKVEGLERHARPRAVRYSAAITAESRRKEIVSAVKFRIYGFRDVKAKVGVAGQDDPRRLETLRRILGRRMDIRIDANEAWRADVLIERVAPLLRFRPSLLEQPVPHAQVDALAELRLRLGVPVMLDESLCGWPDGVAAIERKTADYFNVRLSKCGGLLPSLRLIGLARRNGLGVQLGCHPGETAILSAAGRHVAGRVAGIRYLEGSYDRHILKANLTAADLTFGYGGRARPIDGHGLGIEVDPALLAAMTTETKVIDYA
ncbi:enolase C-terminal domain-like protein [Paludisphaera mucosa]|uniref:Enolase C-terminal domain-like protein n=1 Tax=Paludisphaera mucosa TaxID=3030827 RepID=A0ABT6F5Y9_9BACT|nr:enolase C-terminal domain-like protein [Paludisphaera mucosa]MDG3002990.1 enolase C-terminal domain-like protein [Paludisphaera mucosa]